MLIEFPLQFTCILGDLGVAMHTCVMHISKSLYVDLFRRFCTRSLLRDSLDYSLIDKIPGRPNDRKTLLGELNWILIPCYFVACGRLLGTVSLLRLL